MIDPQVNKERWKLYALGYFDRQIAEKQQVHKNSVSDWRKARGLPPNQPGMVIRSHMKEVNV